jgi:hypothetical protein
MLHDIPLAMPVARSSRNSAHEVTGRAERLLHAGTYISSYTTPYLHDTGEEVFDAAATQELGYRCDRSSPDHADPGTSPLWFWHC